MLAQLEVESLGEACHDKRLRCVEYPGKAPDTQVAEDLATSVVKRERVGLPGCERCLNALPQPVDEQGAVADCGKRAHDVEHGRYRGYDESPALSRSDLPEATGRVERVRGALLV